MCITIERGEITVAEGIAMVEDARHALIQQRQEERQKKEKPKF